MADAEENTLTEEEVAEQAELKKQKRKKIISHLQVVGLVFLLFALMTTSVVTALMATGVINVSPAANNGPANSMTDAQLICDKALQDEHGDKLQMFSMDDLSSHADGSRGGFKLYYELNMFRDASRQSGVTKFYVNCFVSASGRVRQLDLLEEKNYVPKAGRRTKGNAFGL